LSLQGPAIAEVSTWSDIKGRWTTFGNIGRLKLMIESAAEVVENERRPASRAAEEHDRFWPKSS
jgi:hypothetical protein